MRARLVVLVFLVLGCAGCIPSLQPLYTDRDLVFEPALVGRWQGDDKTSWTFSQTGDRAYTLDIVEDGIKDRFSAHLLRLDGVLFLDLVPTEGNVGGNGATRAFADPKRFYDGHLVPAHTFWRTSIAGDTLKFRALDDAWLKRQIDAGTVTIAHTTLGSARDLVFTAPTSELQKLVAKYANDAAAFPAKSESEFHRAR